MTFDEGYYHQYVSMRYSFSIYFEEATPWVNFINFVIFNGFIFDLKKKVYDKINSNYRMSTYI